MTDDPLLNFYFPEAYSKIDYLEDMHQAEIDTANTDGSWSLSSLPWEAVAAVVLPNLGGYISGYVSDMPGAFKEWEGRMKQPSWSPPKVMFPIVWTSLYSGMGFASYLVYREAGGLTGSAQLPLAMYGAQLALNFAWSPIFFGKRSLKGGLVVCLLLDAAVIATTILFYRVTPLAGHLMVPYLGWLSLATTLNYRMWKDNPHLSDRKSSK